MKRIIKVAVVYASLMLGLVSTGVADALTSGWVIFSSGGNLVGFPRSGGTPDDAVLLAEGTNLGEASSLTGNVYYLEQSPQQLMKLGSPTPVYAGPELTQVSGLCVSLNGSKVFVTTTSSYGVVEINPLSQTATAYGSTTRSTSCAVDPDGTLLLTQPTEDPPGAYRLTFNSGVPVLPPTIEIEVDEPTSVSVFHATGEVWVANAFGDVFRALNEVVVPVALSDLVTTLVVDNFTGENAVFGMGSHKLVRLDLNPDQNYAIVGEQVLVEDADLIPTSTGPTIFDGNVECTDTGDFDCCTPQGFFEAADTICGNGDPCSGDERCNSIGQCITNPPLACDDGNICTVDACEVGVGCTTTPTNEGLSCDDLNGCTLAETCQAGVCTNASPKDCRDGDPCTLDECVAPSGTCTHSSDPATPAQVTVLATSSVLKVIDKEDSKGDKLQWKWSNGVVPVSLLGDPELTTEYCVQAWENASSSPVRFYQARIPAGGLCRGKSCWAKIGKPVAVTGYKYKDPDATQVGATQLQLKSGSKASISFQAKGPNIGMPAPATPSALLRPDVIVQISNEAGLVAQSAFNAPALKSTVGQFGDKLQ